MLSSTQAQAIKELICQLSTDTERAKNDLCQALADISTECTGLEVPQDQEVTLITAIEDFNKASIRCLERTEAWYTHLRSRLSGTGIDIDPTLAFFG